MADLDLNVTIKKEAKSSLQIYKDQSLLRRKFGDSAVELYNSIGVKKTASGLMESLGMDEAKFVQIIEFMNNNAMVSIASPEGPSVPEKEGGAKEAAKEGAEEAPEEGAPSKPIAPVAELSAKDKDLLSPLEKIIYEKYGQVGVRIYNLIDGEKTAEEILRETGVSEAKLVEVLEFMDEEGIIKLEKPEQEAEKEGAEEEETPSEEAPEKEHEPRFKPIIEDVPEGKPFKPVLPPPPPIKEKKAEEEPEEEIVLVDVPETARLSIMQKTLMFVELSTKFGKAAQEMVNLMDGKKDFVDLSLATGLSFFDIDSIMAYFGKKGMVNFRQLTREEIKKKYGEDGFAIYKKYGRDGLLLYEMIGKETSLKDIILKSKIQPDRAIDIFVFIHKVLGLDIPIDRDVIYRQIGLKKPI